MTSDVAILDVSFVSQPTDPGASMPPMMITRESSIGEFDVEYGGEQIHYHIFVAPYNSRDCYYFVPEVALSELPATRLGIQKIAHLGVYCEDWNVPVKSRFGSDHRAVILQAAQNILVVDEVHEL